MKRRNFVIGGAAAVGAGAFAFRRKIRGAVSRLTRDSSFAETPPLLPHRADERSNVYVASGAPPAGNIDAVLDKVDLAKVVGADDIVIVKVSAQWWNQGMTNVAAAKRVIERILALPGFRGEVVVFENTHFRLADGSGLARAFTRPSERNVDVDGWSSLGDLVKHHKDSERVSFVGLVDAATSELAGDHWHDPEHQHGVYGGDGRGPIGSEQRDGYHWDFDRAFERKRSWLDTSRTPLSWPVFRSPRTGTMIDLAKGVAGRKLTWISMVTVNAHGSTGMTACCKSAMGVVDMSCGRFGTDPRTDGYQSIHYFGNPDATWRMAGPLAYFANTVRKPDLYLAVAEWVALQPPGPWDDEHHDIRLEASSAHRANTVVAGSDAVAVDAHCATHLLGPIADAIKSPNKAEIDLANPDSKLSRFLRYYREVANGGVLDPARVTVG